MRVFFTGDLILVVKSKEVTQEQQEKELFQTRQEAEQLRSESSKLQQDLQLRLTNVTKERDLLLQRIRISEERSEGLQTDLKRACSVSREDEGEVQRAEGEVQRSEVAEATDDVFVEQEATPEVAVNFEVSVMSNLWWCVLKGRYTFGNCQSPT